MTKRMKPLPRVGKCRCCGCTDLDCVQCVEKTGYACSWANPQQDLCTACICDRCGIDAAGQVIYVFPRVESMPGIYSTDPVLWCSKCRQQRSGLYRRADHVHAG